MLCANSVGSALLAIWIVVRFPALAAASGRRVTAGLVGTCLVLLTAPSASGPVGRDLGAPAALLLVVLPVFTGLFLAVAMLMLYVARRITPFRR